MHYEETRLEATTGMAGPNKENAARTNG